MKPVVVLALLALYAAPQALAQSAGDAQLRNLLLSSPWCSFSYNKNTGYSRTTRYQFSPNGSYGKSTRAEGASSGRGGNLASQANSGSAGNWEVRRGRLMLSEGAGALQDANTVVKRNSSGMPILVADGVEYSKCR